jgi:hypothetical protein
MQFFLSVGHKIKGIACKVGLEKDLSMTAGTAWPQEMEGTCLKSPGPIVKFVAPTPIAL